MTTSACVSFTLSLPPTTNHIWRVTRQGRIYKTEEAKAWEQDAGFAAYYARVLARVPMAPKGVPVEVRVNYVLRYRRDADNGKLILDAFKGVLYDDDDQVFHLDTWKRKAAPGETPRVDVVVAWEVAG